MALVFDLNTGQFCEEDTFCRKPTGTTAPEESATSTTEELDLRLQEYTETSTDAAPSMPSELASTDVTTFIQRMSRKGR